MKFDRLQENNKQVDASVIKASLKFLPFSIIIAIIGYAFQYSIPVIITSSLLIMIGCLLPLIFSKLNLFQTNRIAIISFTIISTTLFYFGNRAGLIMFFFVSIGIACSYFNIKLLKFSFIIMTIGICFSMFLISLRENGFSMNLAKDSITKILFDIFMGFFVYTFYKDFVMRANQIFEDVLIKDDKLQGVNDNIGITTKKLIHVVDSLKVQSDEAAGGTEQIALDINDMLLRVKNQTITIDEVYSKLLIIQKGINNIQENIQKISDDSALANSLATDGKILIGQSSEKDKEVLSSINSAEEKVDDLCTKIDTAFDFVNQVKQIASQSKLLALNASIEASRAGESGKGFAVVADEVSKLAVQTTATATEVYNILDNLKNESNEVSKAMNFTKTTVEEGVNLSREVDEKFETIVLNNENISKYIVSLSGDVTQQLVTPIEMITNELENMKESIHSHNNAINELASVSEELSAMTEDLNTSAVELSNTSKSLETLLE